MRAAAGLLTGASTVDGLGELLRGARLGHTASYPLPPETIDALGVVGATDVRMGGGVGEIRILAARLDGQSLFRDAVQRLVARLATRAPHVLWVLGLVAGDGRQAALVSWSTAGRSRKTVSFAWEPSRPVDSDAETLCALHAAGTDDDGLTHARYLEILGRDSLTRRFYRALEAQVGLLAGSAPAGRREQAKAVALLYVSRLLFLSFLEAKGWLDGERAFLSSRFDRCMAAGGAFHRRVLLPLFFGTLNTPACRRAPAARAFGRIPFLNGGLFTRTAIERRCGRWFFPDEQLGALFQEVFGRFRFVAREDSATWSEAAVDPEMLGRAFESLMSEPERKSGGVFFTPHELVARVTDEALLAWAPRTPSAWHDLRVLDPACGSGAFLVYALERIAERRRRAGETGGLAAIRRDVLARSIFGVDRNPTAVWLCELRLWLSVVIELDEDDPMLVPPLPNLDRNIRVGDALAGTGFADPLPDGSRRMASLRARYVRAVGSRKAALARTLDREERRRTVARLDREIAGLRHARREQVVAMRAKDLFGERSPAPAKADTRGLRAKLRAARAEWRRVSLGGALPFCFGTLFAEAHAAGGFDVIVGNPPWVRLHRIPERLRAQFRESFEVYRAASWRAGAERARAASGFASQVDLSALFVERAIALLRHGGTVSLLLPVKLWQSLAGGGVRRLLLDGARLLRVEDLSGMPHAFEAAVYPSLMLARKTSAPGKDLTIARHDSSGFREWRVSADALAFDESPGAPWLLLAPPARAAFLHLKHAGPPLAESRFGPPRLGVKSGCNSAFVVRLIESASTHAVIEDADGERGKVETHLLRPALRGDAVTPWIRPPAKEWIVWTHDDRGPLPRLPDHARRWLRRRYGQLTARSDAGRSRRWWSLFRVDAASSDRPRVVWADFGRRPRALVLPENDPTTPLNTCYVLRVPAEADAWALAAILNSRLAAAWLNAIAEPARGGYRRYLGWTVGQLPLPQRWDAVRDDLSVAALRASRGMLDEQALLEVVLRAYNVRGRDVEELLTSCDR